MHYQSCGTRSWQLCEGVRALLVIGKVLRGTNASGLLRYLYGLGQANEHTDPHLVAGFYDPAGSGARTVWFEISYP